MPLDSVAHERTWMAWPDSTAIWGEHLLAGAQADIALVARTIARYEPVIVCANARSVRAARLICGPSVMVIGSIPVDDCWMRDTGPIFRTDGSGRRDAIGLNFNGWGRKQTHANDALVARRVAAHAGVPFTVAGLVSEGGAIETDGAGILMATRSSILNANRNPGRSRRELERAMCAAYGASKVIWFAGIAGHDITDDHVDATSRFLSPGRTLVQLPDRSETDIWATDERQQRATLAVSIDARGTRIHVRRCRGPNYALIRQSRAPGFVGAYVNYYVCNGAVICAQFGDHTTDAAAKATLAAAFPNRVIETLNIDYLGLGGGGIHCVTQPEPSP